MRLQRPVLSVLDFMIPNAGNNGLQLQSKFAKVL
jgi:hypothetical protein